jgi:mRNA interferase RelE/StbE
MSYTILFKKSAAKELASFPTDTRKRIVEALETLKINPFSELLKFKKLKSNENLYRIRVGDYRVVYTVERDKLIIVVIKVGHRKDVYLKLS